MSKYSIESKDNRVALFKDDKQVSDYYDQIYADPLIKNQSEYYIATVDKYSAIFHKDNKNKPVFPWNTDISLPILHYYKFI